MDPEVLIVPIVLFLVVVAPIWLVLHYKSKRQVSQGLSEDEFKQLNELITRADKMGQRIETLEAILDTEAPEWRAKDDSSK
ncbi:envelope stress response membrane protein PspB [Parashewanella spongiae]|uniref:Envelope stress response membrane protein PspB n=1 Tax=Parashewanella spongiae TaxID=342950 RepID=A0A3A6T8R8_9GAMM|nr:envelope stress response membrane protein PspB [Parashewanella spongiae]MCL1079361.1 envelope stress response membrane protein PspB [Parashewanella spongiae]RJY11124.1 envelope stress response membrane protein PspB [Parashewanella spongiae]